MVGKAVSILGCGWLGLPLAESLIASGYPTLGSTTTEKTATLLRQKKIEAFVLNCTPELTGPETKNFFQADIMVIMLPFRRDLKDPGIYVRQIQSVIDHLKNSSVSFVIFTSSTSIYPETIAMAREDEDVIPDSARSRALFQAEKLLMESSCFDATVVRFAGMYGGDRKIGRFLSGQEALKGGKRPVNLIHRDDCVGIILAIIEQDVRGEIFNAVSDGHPSRKDLYIKAALRQGFPAPVFEDDAGHSGHSGKIVSNDKVKAGLNYKFKYPDPLVFLDLENESART